MTTNCTSFEIHTAFHLDDIQKEISYAPSTLARVNDESSGDDAFSEKKISKFIFH